jgi:hypothetical protein
LKEVVTLDCFTIRLVVSHNRLRKGNAQILYGHFILLIGSGHAPQMSREIFERFVIVLWQFNEQLLD